MNKEALTNLIDTAFKEDLQTGDHSSLACVNEQAIGKAKLIVKDSGIIAGVEVASTIFHQYDSSITFSKSLKDGESVSPGDLAFVVEGKAQSILACERLVLNCMQRMSGIATYTSSLVNIIKGTNTKLLDTRKTTPNFRLLEKEAVRIGGGVNHRFGLYDMIMLKDNHIDYAGGIEAAVNKTRAYLEENQLDLKVEVEVRNFEELDQVLAVGKVDRIMLDNFSPSALKQALEIINNQTETEASGGITESTLLDYAKTGVDYISVGALTHQVKSLDLSLKAC